MQVFIYFGMIQEIRMLIRQDQTCSRLGQALEPHQILIVAKNIRIQTGKLGFWIMDTFPTLRAWGFYLNHSKIFSDNCHFVFYSWEFPI